MGRKIREIIPGATYHVFSRCIDKRNYMKSDVMKNLMVEVVRETQEKYDFELNSIEILDNHFHFIIRITSNIDTISRIMQRIKSVFAKKFNKMHGRSGPFWNERFGSSIIEKARDATRYIVHLLWYTAYNCVRKGKTINPRNYRYSSIMAYLDENYKGSLKITQHSGFMSLGNNFKERLKVFLEYEKVYVDYLRCQRH